MNVAEMVGGVLYHCDDPEAASRSLLRILLDPSGSSDRARAEGLDPTLVDVLRRTLSPDSAALAVACSLGAAWVSGRRSARTEEMWEPVLTIAPAMPLPEGARRGTAETLVGLINGAKRRIRIAAPFIDEVGVGYLVGPLAAATTRAISVELILSGASDWLDRALQVLREGINHEGDWTRVAVLRVTDPLPWPHLKVVTVDGSAAYVGSANITGPGLAGRNLELGVLVRGQQVETIERTLDLIPVERHDLSGLGG